MELGANKDELSAFRAEVAKEKKALEVEYDACFEAILGTAVAPLHTTFVEVSRRSQKGCRVR